MKKLSLMIIGALLSLHAYTGEVGLPSEHLALPAVSGAHLVCIWDDSAQAWIDADFETYDHSGTYSFQVPAWDQWYWVGLWDSANSKYVFGKWIGHFITE